MKKSNLLTVLAVAFFSLLIGGLLASNLVKSSTNTSNTESINQVSKDVSKSDIEEEDKKENEISQQEQKDINDRVAKYLMDEIVTPFFEDSRYILEDEIMNIYLDVPKDAMIGFLMDYDNGGDKWEGITNNIDKISIDASEISRIQGGTFIVAISIRNPENKENIVYSTLDGQTVYNIVDDL